MKICSKEGGLILSQLGIQFPAANVPIEVDEKTAEVILRNPTFYEYKGNIEAIQPDTFETKKGKLKVVKQGKSFAEITYEKEGGE